MPFLAMFKSSPTIVNSTTLDDYSGAHPARARPNTSTPLKTALATSSTSVNMPDISLMSVLIPLTILATQLLLPNKRVRMCHRACAEDRVWARRSEMR
ncbi:uncharacterized protein UHOD_11397 [Ustilago sp. UG-2017b]|nr:uncharacterized protein UHOD_11397 [Ustilago sp. UG-2017b]